MPAQSRKPYSIKLQMKALKVWRCSKGCCLSEGSDEREWHLYVGELLIQSLGWPDSSNGRALVGFSQGSRGPGFNSWPGHVIFFIHIHIHIHIILGGCQTFRLAREIPCQSLGFPEDCQSLAGFGGYLGNMVCPTKIVADGEAQKFE